MTRIPFLTNICNIYMHEMIKSLESDILKWNFAEDQILLSDSKDDLQRTIIYFAQHYKTVWNENILTKV